MLFRGHGLLFGGALLLVACGSSRPTQKLCAKTNAVFDANSTNQQSSIKSGETRDPAAAILVFKATSNKITIESRCNARLMHRLDVTTKDGRASPRPIDFNNLKFQIENNTGTMELHSSNHCFFRIWDPRDPKQVENNPSLAEEPVKSILSSPLERYHLYKSLLTSSQKLVLFASNGAPVEFEYKFSGQEIYSQFFKKVDALQADTYRFVVGREFSKTSIILDELALDVCGAQEKILQRMDDSPSMSRNSVTDLASFISFYRGQKGFVAEPYRRGLLNSGRNKTCISQTDFVVVPIKFTGELSPQQKAITTEIFTRQVADANELTNKIENVFRDPNINIGDMVSEITPELKYRELPLEESARSQFVQNTLKLPSTCGNWLSEYPGLMLTAPTAALSSARMSKFQFKTEQFAGIEHVTKSIFPNLAKNSFQNPLAPVVMSETLNSLLREHECKMRGFNYDSPNGGADYCMDGSLTPAGNTVPDIDSETGACPPFVETYRIHAARIHLNVVSSIRLALSSAILNLEKYRQKHKESLLLPLAQLRDGTGPELYNISSQNDKSVFLRMKKILDEMDGEYATVTKFYDSLTVDSISPDLELQCTLRTRAEAKDNPSAVSVEYIYDNLSKASKTLLNAGFTKEDSFRYYRNFASRYLTIRCINAPSQLLLSGFSKAPGLHQFLRDARISFIASDALPSQQSGLPTKTLIETGRPVQLSLQQFISQSSLSDMRYQHEINAYLMSEGHIEISYCNKQSALRSENLGGYCNFNLVNREFLTQYKNRYSGEFDETNGRLALFDPDKPLFTNLVNQGMASEAPKTQTFATALPVLFAHLNVLTSIPRWYPEKLKAKLGPRAYPTDGFNESSGQYALGPGDSGTTISLFGLFPTFMVSAVNDVPVSGGLAVIPSTGGQVVQPKSSGVCR